MFCPSCGAEERQRGQFCRACGTDMRTVRTALEKTDDVTASAAKARDEIGRAIAYKIQQLKTVKELKQVTEEILPEVEKFLESPEERRLRRIRTGVVTSSVGLGVMLLLMLSSVPGRVFIMFGWPGGLLVFLIGLGVIINGLYFTLPGKSVPDNVPNAQMQNLLDQMPNTSALSPVETSQQYLEPPVSITEHTTHKLPPVPLKSAERNTR